MIGNDKYEGFVPDMLKKLTQILGVNFSINLVKDGRLTPLLIFINKTAKWTSSFISFQYTDGTKLLLRIIIYKLLYLKYSRLKRVIS